MNTELMEALTILEKEKNISRDTMMDAIENSLISACKNHFGTSDNIKVIMNRETCDYAVYAEKEVVEEVFDPAIEITLEDAEEIVEDSLLWIWENRENLFIETSLSSYLFKMIYRKALNKLAHIDATQRADTRFYEEMQEMLQDTDLYQVEELTQRIKDAIATLPESYREAFVMHRFRDMSYKEIAEILGVSPKTVDYRIQQALKQLRVDLKDYLPLLLPILFP